MSDLGPLWPSCSTQIAGPRSTVGRAPDSIGHRYPVWPHTFVSPSADSRGAVVVTGKSMCSKYWLTT